MDSSHLNITGIIDGSSVQFRLNIMFVSQIQSMVRMHQARKKYKDRLKYFQDHVSISRLKPFNCKSNLKKQDESIYCQRNVELNKGLVS